MNSCAYLVRTTIFFANRTHNSYMRSITNWQEYKLKAIIYTQYGSPDVLQYTAIEKPTPKDDEILIKVHAASISPLDWRLVAATPFLARLENGLTRPKNPLLGADIAGRVEAVGNKITKFKVGDAVFGEKFKTGLGGLAEYVCGTEDSFVLKPSNISFDQASTVPVSGMTALQSLRDHGKIQAGQNVLINGASGGVGTFAVQIAKAFGAHVTGVSSTRNLELVQSLGADQVIDYTKSNFTTMPKQYDLIIDTVGNHSISALKRVLKPQGITSIIGFSSFSGLLTHAITGAILSSKEQKLGLLGTFKPNVADLQTLQRYLENGQIIPVIDKVYPLSDTAEAMRHVMTGRVSGKVVITIADE